MKQITIEVVNIAKEEDNLLIITDTNSLEHLSRSLTALEFDFVKRSAKNKIRDFFFPRGESMVIVKILKAETNHVIAKEEARILGNDALQIIHQYKLKSIVVRYVAETNRAYEVVEGMALGSYQFLKYFSKPTTKENSLKTIKVESSTLDAATVQELSVVVEAVFLARTMVNEPFSYLDTPQMSKEIGKMAKSAGFGFEFLNKEKIQSLKMGGVLAVNQASDVPAHFNILEWKPDNATNEKPIILVGKGVVYDTGGLSLKPSEGMEYMKCDMGGAATVAGTMYVAAKNKLPLHIIGLIPATDNKIGINAIAPGDIITMYSGTTVEVLNTDAEGRLILADALHYAKKYNPLIVIDFATLTGAAVRALGTYGSLYFSTASEKIKTSLEKSGQETYERLAELPLWREYDDDLKSNIADLKNIGGIAAGASTAAKFLEHFTDYPWVHIDIAGSAYLKTQQSYRTKEGTGVGIRLMYHFLKNNFATNS